VSKLKTIVVKDSAQLADVLNDEEWGTQRMSGRDINYICPLCHCLIPLSEDIKKMHVDFHVEELKRVERCV
jgi:hypothetical protein